MLTYTLVTVKCENFIISINGAATCLQGIVMYFCGSALGENTMYALSEKFLNEVP